MKIDEILYSPEFVKTWKKVPSKIKNQAIKKEKIFRQDCFHPSLKTHKLKGQLKDQWSFSIDYHWRIVFHLEDDRAVFTTIGTHKVYR